MSDQQVRYLKHASSMPGVVLLSAVFPLALGAGQALAMATGAYQAPDISQFLLLSEEDGDGDGDGVKETHILRYRNLAGDRVFSMTTKGRLWAWSLESHAGAGGADQERNYVIRDSDCDGVFDERYRLDEQFHVPACLK
jgi:hypothetical protein